MWLCLCVGQLLLALSIVVIGRPFVSSITFKWNFINCNWNCSVCTKQEQQQQQHRHAETAEIAACFNNVRLDHLLVDDDDERATDNVVCTNYVFTVLPAHSKTGESRLRAQ